MYVGVVVVVVVVVVKGVESVRTPRTRSSSARSSVLISVHLGLCLDVGVGVGGREWDGVRV